MSNGCTETMTPGARRNRRFRPEAARLPAFPPSARRGFGSRPPAAILALIIAAACRPGPPEDASPLVTPDGIGTEFVRLALALEEHDPGFVDYRFAGAGDVGEPLSLRALAPRAARLAAVSRRAAGASRSAPAAGPQARRFRYLAAAAEALDVRVRMLRGESIPPAEELERVFGLRWRPPDVDLAALHRAVDRALPGVAPLTVRVRRRYRSGGLDGDEAASRLRRALARCRELASPEGLLPFPLSALVIEASPPKGAGAATPFYRYDGGGRGRLLLPLARFRASEIERLACHEGVPGHHLQAAAAEAHFRATGWPELGVAPLYGPRTAVFEGLAAAVETLLPQDPADAALRRLDPIANAILLQYLEGRATRLEAFRALDFEALAPDPHALLAHADAFGGYALVRPSADPAFEEALRRIVGSASTPADLAAAVLAAVENALTPRDLIAFSALPR